MIVVKGHLFIIVCQKQHLFLFLYTIAFYRVIDRSSKKICKFNIEGKKLKSNIR